MPSQITRNPFSHVRLLLGPKPALRADIASAALVFLLCFLGAAPLQAAGLTPQEALKRMKVADGFTVSLVASEPEIRQPLATGFDERGRLWVIQYLQYPTPAGVNPVQVDQYLRTRYDRLPNPPPRGPKGADRITVCEDVDGDGRADRFKDFVGDLNLCTGFALGNDGVYVLQAPYLLFYPDKDHDDVPDGDPEVLLTGFGMEDAHALANSLQWGPDGWLYGAQGSTVTAKIRGLEFQQGIWRYHPLTREFELFAEGGGNTWGLDFDDLGNIIAGTNFGDQIGLHQVQGAYYVKNFGKHGDLHNPYAFGHFEHIPYKGFVGGHVTCGGVLYHGGTFPKSFEGAYIAANLLANTVYWHTLEPLGSSFSGKFGGTLLDAHDSWFRPVDCEVGPDGALYVADWNDQRATHLDPQDNWDRSNGRIYRIQRAGAPRTPRFDLGKLGSDDLLALMGHPNDWFLREVRRLLSEKRETRLLSKLERIVFESSQPRLALNALWTYYGIANADALKDGTNHTASPISDNLALRLLNHQQPAVRAWTTRLLGDDKVVSPPVAARFAQMARTDRSPIVRSQLASTSKRLPGTNALPILQALMARSEDAVDPHIPMLIWWALADKIATNRQDVLGLFAVPSVWSLPIVDQFLIERLARRDALAGSPADLDGIAHLLAEAPTMASREKVLAGLEKGFEGRARIEAPDSLRSAIEQCWMANTTSVRLARMSLRLGLKGAADAALVQLADQRVPVKERVSLLEPLAATQDEQLLPKFLDWLTFSTTENERAFQGGIIRALASFPQTNVATALTENYARFSITNRLAALATLASRAPWALQLLDSVERGEIPKAEVSLDRVRQMYALNDPKLDALLVKNWGSIQSATTVQKENFIHNLKLLLMPSGAAPARHPDLAAGKAVFTQRCAICHQLFGEGNLIGPQLSGVDRKNLVQLIRDIVNPSAFIRAEYTPYLAQTKDGRLLSGLIVETTEETLTLLGQDNQRVTLDKNRITSLKPSKISMMPEGLLNDLNDQQYIDFFGYLQSEAPATPAAAPAKP